MRTCLAAIVLLLAISCAPAQEDAAPIELLPPYDTEGLAPIFDPIFEPMGLRLVLGNLHDPDDYAISPGGTHLALYLEPSEEWDPARYARAVMPTLRPLTPEVFERWTALASFDICLALPDSDPAADAPEAVTQVVVNREAILELDWERATLADLRDAAERTESIEVRAFGAITETAEWRDAARTPDDEPAEPR